MSFDSQLAEKGLDAKVLEKDRLQGIAEKYRSQGFEVVIEPSKSLLPFDLRSYCPDLIARKGLDEGYIIELKNSIAKISVDRYREIIGEVEVAFWYLRGILEAAMRRQARQVAIPIERFPANSLINHLYSR